MNTSEGLFNSIISLVHFRPGNYLQNFYGKPNTSINTLEIPTGTTDYRETESAELHNYENILN